MAKCYLKEEKKNCDNWWANITLMGMASVEQLSPALRASFTASIPS